MKLLVSFGILFCLGFVYSHETNYAVSKLEDTYVVDGYTYFISWPFKTSWFGANEFCRYRGMYLVDIPTYAEHQRLISILLFMNSTIYTEKNFWTSGTDLGREGQFVWMSSGHPFTYTSWGTNQPDNTISVDKKETDNCVEFTLNLWNDQPCSLRRSFICRNKLINPLLQTPSPECNIEKPPNRGPTVRII